MFKFLRTIAWAVLHPIAAVKALFSYNIPTRSPQHTKKNKAELRTLSGHLAERLLNEPTISEPHELVQMAANYKFVIYDRCLGNQPDNLDDGPLAMAIYEHMIPTRTHAMAYALNDASSAAAGSGSGIDRSAVEVLRNAGFGLIRVPASSYRPLINALKAVDIEVYDAEGNLKPCRVFSGGKGAGGTSPGGPGPALGRDGKIAASDPDPRKQPAYVDSDKPIAATDTAPEAADTDAAPEADSDGD